MGTTIDEYNAVKEYHACVETIIDRLWTESVKYQMMQADYETRLKADMVAMLEELDLQIDESAAYNLEVAKVQRLIRDKIDKLKESKE